jgi:hypothetical protein
MFAAVGPAITWPGMVRTRIKLGASSPVRKPRRNVRADTAHPSRTWARCQPTVGHPRIVCAATVHVNTTAEDGARSAQTVRASGRLQPHWASAVPARDVVCSLQARGSACAEPV